MRGSSELLALGLSGSTDDGKACERGRRSGCTSARRQPLPTTIGRSGFSEHASGTHPAVGLHRSPWPAHARRSVKDQTLIGLLLQVDRVQIPSRCSSTRRRSESSIQTGRHSSRATRICSAHLPPQGQLPTLHCLMQGVPLAGMEPGKSPKRTWTHPIPVAQVMLRVQVQPPLPPLAQSS
jgi:hypothetical protein